MASGDTLAVFTPLHNEPPASDYATLDLRNRIPVLDFDDSTDKSAVFSAVMPRNFSGGGLVVAVAWMATSATTGQVVWKGAFERHQDDTDDLDADGFAIAPTVTATTATLAGEPKYSEITFSAAQIDGVAVGEHFRFKLTRDTGAPGDSLVGDSELLSVEIREA